MEVLEKREKEWLKKKYMAAAAKMRPVTERGQVAKAGRVEVKVVLREPAQDKLGEKEEREEVVNDNYAYDLILFSMKTKVGAVPAGDDIDALHSKLIQKEKKSEEKRAKEQGKGVEKPQHTIAKKENEANKTGFKTVKVGKQILKDYDYEY